MNEELRLKTLIKMYHHEFDTYLKYLDTKEKLEAIHKKDFVTTLKLEGINIAIYETQKIMLKLDAEICPINHSEKDIYTQLTEIY